MSDHLTSLDFLNPGQEWPPPSERSRLKRYQINKWLWQGHHEHVFREAWRRLFRDDIGMSLELIINFPKRLTTLWASLLLGEPPDIQAAEPATQQNVQGQEAQDATPAQDALDRIRKANKLNGVSLEVAIDVSRYGTGIFNCRYQERGIIEATPPTVWYPVVEEDNLKAITHHVLAWVAPMPGNAKQKILKAAIHEPGSITKRRYRLQSLGSGGDAKAGTYKILDLLEEEQVEDTNVDHFLVVPVHNLRTSDEVHGLDDYEDLDSILSSLEIRFAQIDKILDKHSDPHMSGDENALEYDEDKGRWVFKVTGGRFFPVSDGGTKPEYIVWDAELDANMKHIENLFETLYLVTETSPAAFGQLKAGLAESGSALKRLMMAPLSKVTRIREEFDPGLKEALQIVSELEVRGDMQGAVRLDDISITWKDGLPADETEDTTNAVNRVNSRTLSRESAIRRLDGLTGEDLDKELERIAEDEANDAPPGLPVGATGFNFGETGEPEGGGEG